MKIIFLGLLFNEESLRDAYQYSKCGVQMAPHSYQKRLIDGLSQCSNVDLTIINVPPIGSFPMHYKKIISKRLCYDNNVQIGFINIPFIKHQIQTQAIIREIKNQIHTTDECEIIFYSLYKPFLIAVNRIKKEFPNVHITLIQTDAIPGRYKKSSKREIRTGNKLIKLAKIADCFILLSEQLAQPLEIGNRRYMLAECIADITQLCSTVKNKSDNIFLYTGATQKEFGFIEFVDAFEYLPEATLWICGSGNADAYIKEKMNKCKNIKHFGYLKQEEVAQLRDKCDFLINPRRPSGTYTKYSFPSKTAEYLASGKPTIMYRLEAIPKEYDDYLIYLSELLPSEIASELRNITKNDYNKYKEIGLKARHFIINNKGSVMQAERVCKFLSRVFDLIEHSERT